MLDARNRRSFLHFGAALIGCAVPSKLIRAQQNELVRESIYNYIIVARNGSIVSFRRMENGTSISAIDMNRPSFQVIDYTKFLFVAALADPDPSKVLSIGLGAGSFNRLFNLLYPDATLATVEIDPMIRDLAVEFTNFRESARNQVVIEDGRRFLRRSEERWNWIVVDAFVKNSQYPPHLATREFFGLIADHLAPGGLLVINVLRGSKLFDCLVATISSVFAHVVLFDVPGRGNAIAVASANPALEERIKASPLPPSSLLRDNGVDLVQIRAAAAPAHAAGCANPLTDDFSPTEFLGNQLER